MQRKLKILILTFLYISINPSTINPIYIECCSPAKKISGSLSSAILHTKKSTSLFFKNLGVKNNASDNSNNNKAIDKRQNIRTLASDAEINDARTNTAFISPLKRDSETIHGNEKEACEAENNYGSHDNLVSQSKKAQESTTNPPQGYQRYNSLRFDRNNEIECKHLEAKRGRYMPSRSFTLPYMPSPGRTKGKNTDNKFPTKNSSKLLAPLPSKQTDESCEITNSKHRLTKLFIKFPYRDSPKKEDVPVERVISEPHLADFNWNFLEPLPISYNTAPLVENDKFDNPVVSSTALDTSKHNIPPPLPPKSTQRPNQKHTLVTRLTLEAKNPDSNKRSELDQTTTELQTIKSTNHENKQSTENIRRIQARALPAIPSVEKKEEECNDQELVDAVTVQKNNTSDDTTKRSKHYFDMLRHAKRFISYATKRLKIQSKNTIQSHSEPNSSKKLVESIDRNLRPETQIKLASESEVGHESNKTTNTLPCKKKDKCSGNLLTQIRNGTSLARTANTDAFKGLHSPWNKDAVRTGRSSPNIEKHGFLRTTRDVHPPQNDSTEDRKKYVENDYENIN